MTGSQQKVKEAAFFFLTRHYQLFCPGCCTISVLAGMDRYSRQPIQWTWIAGARYNDAFVWAVGGLEKRYETGTPAIHACSSGLVWIAPYPERRPNRHAAGVGQHAPHRNTHRRPTGSASTA